MRRHTSVLWVLAPLFSCSGEDLTPIQTKDPRIVSFKVSPGTVDAGQEVTLTWETVGTAGVDIEPRIGLQIPSGSAIDRPLATTTYRLTVPGGAPDLAAETTVTVIGGAPIVNEFKAMPRTIAEGETSRLEWTTTNANHVIIEPGVGMQPASGSVEVMPRVTTTYRLTAIRGTETAPPQDVRVTVASGNQPIVRAFTASPQTVSPGDPVRLTWETANSTSVSIDNGVGPQPTSGSTTVSPIRTTVYTLTASGNGGTAIDSVTVTVAPAGDPSILRFDANPSTIGPGGQAELSWDTDNAASVSIDHGIGARPAKGTEVVTPAQTTTYTLTAFGNGRQVTRPVTVTVASENQPVILTFTAQPSAVLQGGAATLSWTTQNATSVDIDNGVGTGLPASGSSQISPGQTTTYTLTARGAEGAVTRQATVTVMPAPPSIVSFIAQPASITAGGTSVLSWSTSNATSVSIDNGVGNQPPNGTAQVSPTQTTLYTLTAIGPGGMVSSQVSLSVTAPGAPAIVSFTASPQQIMPGGQAMLSWNVTGANAVSIDNGIGAQPAMGTRSVSPATNTTYTLTAVGPGGQTTAQVTVLVITSIGDRCTDAFVITTSGTFTGNTLQASNDYSQSSSCTGYTSSGPDTVYRVPLLEGDRLRAALNPTVTSWDASLYLVTSCSNVSQSCVAGQDNGNPEEIDYTAVTPGDYFLIVDGFAGAGGTYVLDVVLTPAPIPNDRCEGAIDVGRGGSFAGDTTNAGADYDPGSGGCTGFAEASNDLAYRVSLAPGERLQASLRAAWDSAIYLVTSCTDVAGSCALGQDDGNPEDLDFTAPAQGTYLLIVDGWAGARGAFTLDVTISPPAQGGDTCEAAVAVPQGGGSFQSTTAGLADDYDPPSSCTGFGAPGRDQAYRMDLTEGDVVEVFADFDPAIDGAVYVVVSCADLGSCVAGADRGLTGESESLRFVARTTGSHFAIVDAFDPSSAGPHDVTLLSYSADTCQDAAPLDFSNTAEWFTTAGRANDYSPNAGGCTGFTANAADRAYSIFMIAGEQLQVTVDPDGFDASVYLVSSCSDISGSCIEGSDRGVSTNEELSPVFQQSGVYYVIVDGYGGASGSGTLTARIVDGDTCATAYRVPSNGGVFNGTTGGYGSELGTSSSAGSCTGYTQEGRDAVYAVTLEDGKTLSASLASTWDSALYLVSDCGSSASTCLTGDDGGSPEEIAYTHTGGGSATYYLVVDSWKPSTEATAREGSYTLTVTIE